MEPLAVVHAVDPVVRAAIAAMRSHLAGDAPLRRMPVTVAPGWEPFAIAAGFAVAAGVAVGSSAAGTSAETTTTVVIGPIEHGLQIIDVAAPDTMIGFIAPAAIRRRWWQRGATSFLDPTRQLWQAGASPLAVARIEVRQGSAIVEMVVGHARATPAPLLGQAWPLG